MAQVLVGEILFKMKADADNLVRNLRQLQAQTRAMQAEVDKNNDTLREHNRELSRTSSATDEFRRASERTVLAHRNHRKEILALGAQIKIFGGQMLQALKVPAITQAVTLLTSLIASLSTAFYSLASALAPLSGLLVAYPAMLLTLGASFLVVKSAIAPVAEGMKALASGDMKKIQEAFAAMTPQAQAFTRQLFSMQEALDFAGTAQRGLFPGLLEGLKAASPLLTVVRQQVFTLAQALGNVGRDFGKMLGGTDATGKMIGYNRFYRDTQRLGTMNTVVVNNLGRAFLGLVDSLRSVLAVGAPLVVWLSQGAARLGEWAAQATSASRANGSLNAFFERTAAVAKTLGSTLKNVAGGLAGIGRAGGSAQGFGMLQSMEAAAKRFNEWTRSGAGINQIQKYFADAKPAMNEFLGLLGDIIKMFGRLSTSTGLVKVISDIRTKMLPAFEGMAQSITDRLGPALVNAATAFFNFQKALSFTPLVLFVNAIANVVNWVTKLIDLVPGLGFVIASFLTLGGALKVALSAAKSDTLLTMITMLTRIGVTAGAASTATQAVGASAAAASGGLGAFGAAAAAGGGGLAALASGAAVVAVPMIALGAIFWAVSKRAEEQRKQIEAATSAMQKHLDIIRAGNKSDASYTQAIGNDKLIQSLRTSLDLYKQIQQVQQQAQQRGSMATTQANIDLREREKRLNQEYLQSLKALGPEYQSHKAQVAAMKAVTDSEATARLNALKAAKEQESGYRALTGANLELSNAARKSTTDTNALTAAMGKNALAAAKAINDMGDLVTIFNNTKAKPGQNIFDAFMGNAQKVLAQAKKFTANIQKAMAQGWDPQQLVNLMLQGPEKAGPLLDAMVHNATGANVRLFNEYAGMLNKVAVQAAFQAKIIQEIVAAPTRERIHYAELASAMVNAFLAGTTSAQGLAQKLGISVNMVNRLIDLFHLNLELRPNVNTSAIEAAARRARELLALLNSIGTITPSIANFRVPGSVNRRGLSNQVQRNAVLDANGAVYSDSGSLLSAPVGVRRENHVAQIAPAGAWRVWAEPETGGEAYIPLAMSKRSRSLAILAETARRLRARVFAFATGTGVPVGGASPGVPISLRGLPTPSNVMMVARGQERLLGVAGIEKVIAAYEKYLALMGQIAQRLQLVNDLHKAEIAYAKASAKDRVTEAQNVRDAKKALADFDKEALQQRKTDELQAMLELAQKREQDAAEQLAKKRALEDNKYAIAKASAEAQIAILNRQMEVEQKAAAEWVAGMGRRIAANTEFQQNYQVLAERQIALINKVGAASLDNAAYLDDLYARLTADSTAAATWKKLSEQRTAIVEQDKANDAAYIKILDERMAKEEQYSDEWMSLYQQRKDALDSQAQAAQNYADQMLSYADAMQSAADQALADLNGMLDRVDEINKQMEDAKADNAKTLLNIQKDYDDAVRQANNDRTKSQADALEAYNRDLDNLLADRRRSLEEWARIDEQAGPLTALPIEWLNQNVQQQIAQFRQWSDQLADARRRGVSEEVIAALNLDAGPQSLGQLQAFAAATDAEIAELNRLVLERTKAAGDQVAAERTAGYLQQSAAARDAFKAYTDQLAAIEHTLATAMADAAATRSQAVDDANAALAEQLQGYAEDMQKIGYDSGRSLSEAIEAGLRSGIPGIVAAALAAQAAAAQAANASTAAQAAQAAANAAAAAAAAPPPTPTQPTAPPAPVVTTPWNLQQSASVDISTLPGWSAANAALISSTPFSQLTPRQIAWADIYGVSLQPMTYDSGGILSPGLTMAYNASGHNEIVMTGEQVGRTVLQAMTSGASGGGTGTTVNVYLDGQLIRNMAKVEVYNGLGELQREMRAGRR